MSTLKYDIFNKFAPAQLAAGQEFTGSVLHKFHPVDIPEKMQTGTKKTVQPLTDKEIEEKIKNGDYIPPWEYGKNNDIESTRYKKVETKATVPDDYFWVEELKNWCRFVYGYGASHNYNPHAGWWNRNTSLKRYYVHWTSAEFPFSGFTSQNNKAYAEDSNLWHRWQGFTYFQLSQWNGVDKFIGFAYNNNKDSTKVDIGLQSDELQNRMYKILNSCKKHFQRRGNYMSDKQTVQEDGTVWAIENPKTYDWQYSTNYQPKNDVCSGVNSPVQIVDGLILNKTRNYTILDGDTAQCVRIKEPHYFTQWNSVEASNKPALRQGISAGCPAVWRTASGELMLCTTLIWGGVMAVIGMCDEEGKHDYGVSACDFINKYCRRFFGDGKNKTIADDWIKTDYNINTDEEAEATEVEKIKTADTETMTEGSSQVELKSDKKIKIKFSLADVNISETTSEEISVATKW